jgi:hypothetical protein
MVYVRAQLPYPRNSGTREMANCVKSGSRSRRTCVSRRCSEARWRSSRGGAGGEDQHDEVEVLLVSNVQHGCADVLDKVMGTWGPGPSIGVVGIAAEHVRNVVFKTQNSVCNVLLWESWLRWRWRHVLGS